MRYGRSGLPLIYLPTSGGDETEFERYGMHRDCARWIDSGRLQVFSVDACGPRGLFNDALPPPERMRVYVEFERWAVGALLPAVEACAPGAAIEVVGASYGAFAAANLLLKYPGRVALACGLGGVYEMHHRLEGYRGDEVYFHTPLDYLPGLRDPVLLESIRATEGFWLFAAAADPWLAETQALAARLRDKALPHRLEVWPAPAAHHETWWKRQLRAFLERRHGA